MSIDVTEFAHCLPKGFGRRILWISGKQPTDYGYRSAGLRPSTCIGNDEAMTPVTQRIRSRRLIDRHCQWVREEMKTAASLRLNRLARAYARTGQQKFGITQKAGIRRPSAEIFAIDEASRVRVTA